MGSGWPLSSLICLVFIPIHSTQHIALLIRCADLPRLSFGAADGPGRRGYALDVPRSPHAFGVRGIDACRVRSPSIMESSTCQRTSTSCLAQFLFHICSSRACVDSLIAVHLLFAIVHTKIPFQIDCISTKLLLSPRMIDASP
jgi:hypothetical protein